MGLREVAVKDVLFYDAVGMPYTGTTLRTGAVRRDRDNSIVLLAEELAREGRFGLTVATKTPARAEVSGVEVVAAPRSAPPAAKSPFTCGVRDLHWPDFYKRRILFCTDSVDISLGSYSEYGKQLPQEHGHRGGLPLAARALQAARPDRLALQHA